MQVVKGGVVEGEEREKKRKEKVSDQLLTGYQLTLRAHSPLSADTGGLQQLAKDK